MPVTSVLPISVVIPTRDSMDKLPAHLAAHAEVFSRCAEIIHCDSFSKDATKPTVAAALSAHPRLLQLDHPPGLYASWNYAIERCTQSFIYISTVGDRIDLDSLQRLLALAHESEADVVISPPRFIDEAGRPDQNLRWPIHRLIENHRLETPRLVPSPTLFAEAVFLAQDGIMGSAASCLFRTSFLQPRPFPLGFHGASDSAWALQHLPDSRCAILPEAVSDFLLHPKTYESHGMINASIAVLIRDLLRQEIRRRLNAFVRFPEAPHPLPRELLLLLRDFNLIALLQARRHRDLAARRKKMGPFWFLDPQAWSARLRRDRYRRLARAIASRARGELPRASSVSRREP